MYPASAMGPPKPRAPRYRKYRRNLQKGTSMTAGRSFGSILSPSSCLIVTPRVQRVVQGEFEPQLLVIIRAREIEPFGDRLESGGLWDNVYVDFDVGPVDNLGQLSEGGIVEPVLLDEDFKAAFVPSMGVIGPWRVEGFSPFPPGDLQDLVFWNKEKLGVGIYKLL